MAGFYERRVRIFTRLESNAREIRQHVAGINFSAHDDEFRSDAGSCTISVRGIVSGADLQYIRKWAAENRPLAQIGCQFSPSWNALRVQ